ncbi:MAG: hydrolase TatD [Epulopiscium sp. Nele67-Bin001]|nr:MAG: hydrolase TatD [Epulopiscium sp. Nele67-Bin001]
MKIFDSHAHYNDDKFDDDRETLLLEQLADYVIMNVGADIKSSMEGIELAHKYNHIYASVGVHPHYAEGVTDEDIELLKQLATKDKVMAIGEIGLDFYYDHSPRDVQRSCFKKQLAVAKELKMPVIIHSRDACQETFDILKEANVSDGVIHCFSGSKELALEYIKRGFHIGIGGALTFKNARKTVDVVREIPLDRILLETDAPYLAPVPYRGKRNDSSFLVHVIQKIAEIKGISSDIVATQTFSNARRLYRISNL